MSKADVERLVEDLKKDEALRKGLQAKGTSLAALVEFGRAHGYDITLDDAKAYVAEKTGGALSDADLDAVAGGDGATVVAVMTGPAVVVTSGGDPQVVVVGSTNDQAVIQVMAEAAVSAA